MGIINKVNAICGEADISTATARVYMQIRCNNSMSEYRWAARQYDYECWSLDNERNYD